MKKIIIFLMLSYCLDAFACINYQQLSFCVGDRAIAAGGDGTIIGVSKNKISIDFTGGSTNKSGVGTFDISSVFVGKGCLQEFCVGEKGVGGNQEGEIIGLKAGYVAINHKKSNDKFSLIKTYAISDALVKKGCLEAYCAGEGAVFKAADGIIVGLNQKAKKVAIRFLGGTTRYTGVGTYDLKTVSIGKGCFQGLCLGDSVVSGTLEGKIVGVNPYRAEVSILGKINEKPVIESSSLKNVTMRSLSPNFIATDSRRMIKTVSEFNHSFAASH